MRSTTILKTTCLGLILLLTPGLSISLISKLVPPIPPEDLMKVSKWELWNSDLNITGTERAPIMKTGDADFTAELLSAGVDSLFTGLISLTNSTKYGLSGIVISKDPVNPIPAGLFLNYGEHSGGGGTDVLSVWRFCNLTQSGFCNTGPLMSLGDLSNTLFPSAAMSVSSDTPDSPQILRLNGYFMDTGQMIYLANTADVKAINAENGDLVCTNLNADMVDSFHLDQDVSTTGGPSFAGNVSAQYFIGDGSALTNLPSPDLSGYVPYDGGTSNLTLNGYNITADYFIGDGSLLTNLPVPTTVANATYSNDSDMLDGQHGSYYKDTFSDNGLLYQNGTRPLTNNWDMGLYAISAGTLKMANITAINLTSVLIGGCASNNGYSTGTCEGQTFTTSPNSTFINKITLYLCGASGSMSAIVNVYNNYSKTVLLGSSPSVTIPACGSENAIDFIVNTPVVSNTTGYFFEVVGSSNQLRKYIHSTGSDGYTGGKEYIPTSGCNNYIPTGNPDDLQFLIYYSLPTYYGYLGSTLLPTTSNSYDIGSDANYIRNIYSYQYYAKNTSIVAFDDYKDSELIKSIIKENEYFKMPPEVKDISTSNITVSVVLGTIKRSSNGVVLYDVNTTNKTIVTESLNMGKVHGLELGAIKELVLRVEILESENQKLKEQLVTICKENNLKGCAS